jgi:uridine kinase
MMDGVFLLRPELDACRDYRIWVDVSFRVALEWAKQRDVSLMGSEEEVLARYRARDSPGQQLYLETVHPLERADTLVYNEHPAHPGVKFRQSSRLA